MLSCRRTLPGRVCCPGVLLPGAVGEVLARRLEHRKADFRVNLAEAAGTGPCRIASASSKGNRRRKASRAALPSPTPPALLREAFPGQRGSNGAARINALV